MARPGSVIIKTKAEAVRIQAVLAEFKALSAAAAGTDRAHEASAASTNWQDFLSRAKADLPYVTGLPFSAKSRICPELKQDASTSCTGHKVCCMQMRHVISRLRCRAFWQVVTPNVTNQGRNLRKRRRATAKSTKTTANLSILLI